MASLKSLQIYNIILLYLIGAKLCSLYIFKIIILVKKKKSKDKIVATLVYSSNKTLKFAKYFKQI